MSMQSVGMGGGIAEQATVAAFNKNQAKAGRNFNEAVMKNKVRWMVNDMKRAGINPLTAFMGGGGVSGGATLSGPVATMSGGSASGAMKAGPEAERARKQGDLASAEKTVKEEMPRLMNAQAEAYRAGAAKDRELGSLAFFQGHESVKRADYYKALAQSEGFNARLRELDLPGARNRAAVEASAAGVPLSFTDRILKSLSPVKLGR